MSKRLITGLLAATTLVGCGFDEGFTIENISGTVVLPREFATQTYNVDGQTQELTDVRSIGPVYLGLYSSVEPPEIVTTYPHPQVGPAFDGVGVGDTYPYGGTSIGAFRPICLQALQCKVVSGRFVDWDSMAYWFSDVLGEPILDYFGNEADSGEYIRQTCLEAYNHTTDRELGLTVYEDRNGDDDMNELDLDFVERADGNFEASFEILQQEYFEDQTQQTENGFTLWGLMDAPAPGSGTFGSCVESGAFTRTVDYNSNFVAGTARRTILNRPSSFLQAGDVVAGDQGDGNFGHVFEDIQDNPELWLNFEVQ